MAEENPLDKVLDQIAEILKLTEDELRAPSKKKLSKDLLKQVELLEEQVDYFEELQRSSMEAAQVDKERYKKVLLHTPDDFALRDRRLLERVKELKSGIYQMKNLFDQEVKSVKKEEKKEKKGKKRRKKFRQVGESDKWKKI